jgi:aarF domain-containing kinase
MKGFNFVSLFSQTSPWTCRGCTRLSQLQTRCPHDPLRYSLRYSAKARKPPRSRRRRNIVLAASGAVGVSALAFADDAKHAYKVFERTGRVMGTLAVCIDEYVSEFMTALWVLICPDSYRVTLNQNDKTEDEEEKLVALRACHKRCANRTLEVIEKNGSIFIKLGQHLVSYFIY